MKNNITVYIGKNASGKTRILKDILAKNKNAATNIEEIIDTRLKIDENKLKYTKENEIELWNKVSETFSNPYTKELKNVIQLILYNADVLILDEIDDNLTRQDIIDILALISDLRDSWKEVHISAYDPDVTRVFTQVNNEEGTEETIYNLYYVGDDMKLTKVTEETENEYFNKI